MLLINILAMVVMVSITGSIIFGIWFFLKEKVEKTNPKIVYHILHLVLLTYLVPIVYMLLIFFYSGTIINEIYLFDEANRLYQYATGGCVIWLIAVSILVILEVRRRIRFQRLCRLGFPITDQRIWSILQDIKNQYRIKKDIQLFIHNGITSPMIVGSCKPILLLPETEYTMEEVRMVFMHELAHYKNHDYVWKQLTVVIKLIHCFNPVVYVLLKYVDRWSEINCDISISKWNKISMSDYYNFILSQMMKNLVKKDEKSFLNCLFKDKPELQERMFCVAKYKKRLWWKSIVTIGLVMICCFGGMGVAYAAGEQVVINYDYIHSKYVTLKLETTYPGVSINPIYDSQILLEDELLPNKKKISDLFMKKKGEEILLSVESENGKQIKAGIITPSGEYKYIITSSSGSQLFEIEETGKYRIFLENIDTQMAIGKVVDLLN